MEIVQPKKIAREKTTVQTSVPKESENTYPFQWLLYKPQLHAVEPFEVNKATRKENTARSGDRTHADFSNGS